LQLSISFNFFDRTGPGRAAWLGRDNWRISTSVLVAADFPCTLQELSGMGCIPFQRHEAYRILRSLHWQASVFVRVSRLTSPTKGRSDQWPNKNLVLPSDGRAQPDTGKSLSLQTDFVK
jgi:hypothetical protein